MSTQGRWIFVYFDPDTWEIIFVASKLVVVNFLCALDPVSKKPLRVWG